MTRIHKFKFNCMHLNQRKHDTIDLMNYKALYDPRRKERVTINHFTKGVSSSSRRQSYYYEGKGQLNITTPSINSENNRRLLANGLDLHIGGEIHADLWHSRVVAGSDMESSKGGIE
ncbi:hypothetical protein HHI36_001883 [Cryptolaemus montrouzieri]|uniref:Uncharacterized protein n=1 Tax=Cryptolaemus montrouzieri TaxID=559131 RepID=A0ABD2P9B5_9CUCU